MAQKASDSDIRMMIATQVAYLDGEPGMSVGELVSNTIASYGNRSNLSAREKSQLETAQYIQERISENNLNDCNRWVIKDVCDKNDETGFYGCFIDTRDGDGIIGIRGSEGFDAGQYINDWGKADLGLLNSTGTQQQKIAEQFTRDIYEKYGDYYDGYSFTGHSLGGNLSVHATITAPDGMPIRRCVSYDGPGFSDEYIIAHSADIRARSQYIDHYQYSLVGSLLLPIPGSNYQTIAAHNDEQSDGISSYFVRHHTRNIEFDKNGNVQAGERDALSAAAGPFSIALELSDVPPLVALLCPQYAALVMFIRNADAILQGMKNEVEHLVSSITQTLKSIRESVSNWFRSIFGVALTGEFELNVSYVNSVGDGLDDVSRKLIRISSEISSVTNSLRYNSMVGSLYRSRLKILSNSVQTSGSKASKLGKAVQNCAQYCSASDRKATQIYNVLK